MTETFINLKLKLKLKLMVESTRQIEIGILKTLSDFVPRNQNKITEEIGKDYENSTDRVQVHRAIQKLKKYFERKLLELEERGKKWTLKKDIETMKEIVNDYPELLTTLQSNDTILTMLVDKHVNDIFVDEWLSEDQTLEFKNRLGKSPTFFKLYLLRGSQELRNAFDALFSLTERGQEFERYNRDIMRGVWETEKQIEGNPEKEYKPRDMNMQSFGFAEYQPCFNDLIEVLFKACVEADIIDGQNYTAGAEHIKNLLSAKNKP